MPTDFIKLESVEDAKQVKPIDWTEKPTLLHLRTTQPNYHLGTLSVNRYSENSVTYQILKYLFDNNILPPLKYFKWGAIKDDIKNDKFHAFHGLRHHATNYLSFLQHGWTCRPKSPKVGMIGGMDFQSGDETEKSITDFTSITNPSDWDIHNLSSIYYHSAKAHWLVHSMQEEGLWAPIQGVVESIPEGDDKYRVFIHPGSVRSCVIEELDDPENDCLFFDPYNLLPHIDPIGVDEYLQLWKEKLNKKGVKQDDISLIMNGGVIEIQSSLATLDFRHQVYEFNKKVHLLTNKKPFNIYIGYDSTQNGVEKVCKHSIETTIEKSWSRGRNMDSTYFMPEIKYLDISKIPEYTRPYANQNTEFTYSRFLIPYLENYEGFSMFVDDDFIFTKSLLPMFYFLNPDHAVACIQYPQYKHDTTKFVGAVNIDYPRKLWSSMMIFNNGHEDCKKLTPEAINTWTGAQLHQFQWTEKISKIPEHFIFTEGYDDPETKWNVSGYHYTRGGPWIEGMDCSSIERLEYYEKAKSSMQSK